MRTRYKEVEIDLDEWDDDDLVAELKVRGVTDDDLRVIHEMMKLGKKEQAYEAMNDYIRNKLGVAI